MGKQNKEAKEAADDALAKADAEARDEKIKPDNTLTDEVADETVEAEVEMVGDGKDDRIEYGKEITGQLVCQSMNDEKLIFKLVENPSTENPSPALLGFDKFTIDKKIFPDDVLPQGFDVSGSILITLIARPKKAT